MQDWFDRMMPDPEKWAGQFAAHPVVSRPIVVPMGEPLNPTADGFLVPPAVTEALSGIRKLSTGIIVPDELLMDYGLIPDTRPPRPPTPWRYRIRNKVSDWRERTARRAYKVIAGDWPDNREDW